MSKRNIVNKLWIWMKRFRYRKGYGVHSPFAFELITWVINERLPYYDYKPLKKHRKELITKHTYAKQFNSQKADQLLYRLVNYIQPDIILEYSSIATPSLKYMHSAKKQAKAIRLENEDTFLSRLKTIPEIDMLLFNEKLPCNTAWEKSLEKATGKSLYIISGIHSSNEMKHWWQQIAADDRTGITFDLYELGLVFFDTGKIKQHYLINFEF